MTRDFKEGAVLEVRVRREPVRPYIRRDYAGHESTKRIVVVRQDTRPVLRAGRGIALDRPFGHVRRELQVYYTVRIEGVAREFQLVGSRLTSRYPKPLAYVVLDIKELS